MKKNAKQLSRTMMDFQPSERECRPGYKVGDLVSHKFIVPPTEEIPEPQTITVMGIYDGEYEFAVTRNEPHQTLSRIRHETEERLRLIPVQIPIRQYLSHDEYIKL